MYHSIFYVVKRHGTAKYCKNIFLHSLRQYASRPAKPEVHKTKVFAAASPAFKPLENEDGKSSVTSKTIPNVIGLNEDTTSLPTESSPNITSNAQIPILKAVPVIDSSESLHSRLEEPVICVKNSKCHILTSDLFDSFSNKATDSYFKNSPPLPNLKTSDRFTSPATEAVKIVDTKVNLLNAIKPSDLDWHKQVTNVKHLLQYYLSLSKIRLTSLVVLTTVAGYGMAPAPLDVTTLLFTAIGTGLTSAAANSINQFLEVPYDSQMARTKNRVLIRGLLTPLHAFTFAVCSGTLGISLLYTGCNSLTAFLGGLNLFIYTSLYTPMKRCSILNTWIGSIVGAIPPLMGWAACTGSIGVGGLLMGAILYSWQFPHFNALSWNLRPDYSRAGYQMMSAVNPSLCRRTALRHSIAILCYCTAAPFVDLTSWTFFFDSLPLNCYLIYCTWKFYKNADSQSSRKLFRLSIIHLPVLMLLMFISKKYPEKEKENVKTYL